MKCQAKHIVIVLMLLLVPIYLISCSGYTTTSLPSGKSSEAVKDHPGVPTKVTAVGTDSRINLTWKPPLATGDNAATSYNLYWSTTGGVTDASNKILNVSMPFAHMDLINGQTYYYRVCAMNIYGEGLLSSEVQATPMLPFTKILTKLTDPDAEMWDEFGCAVAIDGDYAVVGAPHSGGLNPYYPWEDIGAAYVFHRDASGNWDPAGTKLMAPDAESGDQFGNSVSISGDYVIIGAVWESGNPADQYYRAGAAYVFHRTGPNTWDAGTKITSLDPQRDGKFGVSVSISGDYAIVGQESQNKAFIFHRTGTNIWDTGTMIGAPEPDGSDNYHFGISVAISGDYAIVGAYNKDGGTANSVPDAGAAYIFHRTGVNAWGEFSKIVHHDYEENDRFGYAVAISGDYAVVGAMDKNNGTGAAYVFHRLDENFWDEGPKIVAPDAQEGDAFGWSVGITDQYVIVGAFGEDCGWDDNYGEGAAYVYERVGANTWDAGTKVTIPQGDSNDQFGYAVAVDGESAIIGAIGDDCGEADETPATGAVYMY